MRWTAGNVWRLPMDEQWFEVQWQEETYRAGKHTGFVWHVINKRFGTEREATEYASEGFDNFPTRVIRCYVCRVVT